MRQGAAGEQVGQRLAWEVGRAVTMPDQVFVGLAILVAFGVQQVKFLTY